MTINERIRMFIEYKRIPIRKFEELCSLSNGYISSMRKGFGSEKLNNVLNVFPDLNRNWLIYGEGDMLNSGNISQSSVGSNNVMVGHDINGNISVEKIHGDNNTHIAGNGNHVNNAPTLQQALSEIAEQRKLVAKSQEQIDRLLTIIEHMTK